MQIADAVMTEPSADIPLEPPVHSRPARGPWLQIGSPRGFEVNRVELPVPGWPAALDGLRLAHLSDLHLRGRWSGVYDAVIEAVNSADADLVLFTGDLVEAKVDHRAALPHARRIMTSLRSRAGTFVTTGNHDGDLLGPRLGAWGVTRLDGRRIRVARGDGAVELIGLPGVNRCDLDDASVLRANHREDGAPRLVLSHFPDAVRRLRPLRPAVVFAGHTHGGQICLPGGRALLSHDSLPRRLVSGVHRVGATWLVVTRGLGFAQRRIRLFCPAEMLIVTLRRAARAEAPRPL